MLLYYITDRTQFPGNEESQRKLLLKKIREAAEAGVDFIQLREKDLSSRDLESLAQEASRRLANTPTRLLINSRGDIALACGAHGVHLRSDDILIADAREVGKRVPNWLVFVSCHSVAEVKQSTGANVAVFAPVFEKKGVRGTGIEVLREACRVEFPVIALGGVTVANARACVEAGAAGVAGIRLFQHGTIFDVVKSLRG